MEEMRGGFDGVCDDDIDEGGGGGGSVWGVRKKMKNLERKKRKKNGERKVEIFFHSIMLEKTGYMSLYVKEEKKSSTSPFLIGHATFYGWRKK